MRLGLESLCQTNLLGALRSAGAPLTQAILTSIRLTLSERRIGIFVVTAELLPGNRCSLQAVYLHHC